MPYEFPFPVLFRLFFLQTCASGYFSCDVTSSVQCIDESFKCDCNIDCTDGSDETNSYAGCDPSLCNFSSANSKFTDLVEMFFFTHVNNLMVLFLAMEYVKINPLLTMIKPLISFSCDVGY